MRFARKHWKRALGVLACAGLVAVAWIYGPPTLRDMDTFKVRQVEVVGTRFLEPYAVVRAAGLDVGSSVFDDADQWLAGVHTLTLVEEVRVGRVLPGKVRLEVREVQPVALVDHEVLRPVDATGRLLDFEPAGVSLDLPIVTGVQVEGDRLVEGASAAAVATLAVLMTRDSGLAGDISQVELSGDDLKLLFREGRTMAIVPAAATPVQLTQLRLTLADLLARGELERARTIDVRFRDQVVVSFLGTP